MPSCIQDQKKNRLQLFTEEQLLGIDFNNTPKHVAIIMDGNRRWAHQHNLPYELGYIKGAEKLKEITRAAIELKIETLTAYAFSTENWRRSKEETSILLKLFNEYLNSECENMVVNGIRLKTIGDITQFPIELQETLYRVQNETNEGKTLCLVLALNYGSRNEMSRVVKKIVQDCLENKLQLSQISESTISNYLDTADLSDPDLLIRTSGEFRLSNFLLWQVAYTEVNILKTYWPDFQVEELLAVIKNYLKRERRCGI